jgi:hypothetical protein
MRTITLYFSEEAARVAIRKYIDECERRGTLALPEFANEVIAELDRLDAEKINEPRAAHIDSHDAFA